MTGTERIKLFANLVALWLLLSVITVAKGGVHFSFHEVDMLHLADVVLRIAGGELPHRDFMTPVGVLAFLPFAAFAKAGAGVGTALLLGQALVAAVLLPAIWWASASRLTRRPALGFGAFALVLVFGLIYGTAQAGISMSMHYNRWAWAIGFVVLLVALVPPQGGGRGGVADGSVIGLGLTALALLKITYFVALLPAVAVALALRRAALPALTALAVAAALAVVITAALGTAFWPAYAADLVAVAESESRPIANRPLSALILSPYYLVVDLLGVVGILAVRRQLGASKALVAALFFLGSVYITYQNWENDPVWLVFWAFLFLASRRELAAPALGAMRVMPLLSLVFIAPSVLNIAVSPLRHLAAPPARFVPLVPGAPRLADIHVAAQRAESLLLQTPYPGAASIPAPQDPTAAAGAPLPDCSLRLGIVGWLHDVAQELEQAGFAGRRVALADQHNALWMFGDFRRPARAAPWYYGGSLRLDGTDIVVAPVCANSVALRDEFVAELPASARVVHSSEGSDMGVRVYALE